MQDVDVSCNRIVDVSGISFCDDTYIGSGNSFDISSNQVLVLSGTVDPSGNYNSASIVSRDRIYQQLDSDPSWNAVNGYYTLAKDAAPAINPNSSGVAAVSTWTRRTAAANNEWRSVCWSPELCRFVAVGFSGTNNRVMTSSDGINWTSQNAATEKRWRSVCWSPELGIFAAVAYDAGGIGGDGQSGNRVMTSDDGFTWISQTTPADKQWLSVCWSPERRLFVAVSNDNADNGSSVMISSNGISWTLQTPAANNRWTAVCWSAQLGLFVAVSDTGVGNRVMTSPDGVIWTSRYVSTDLDWYSICWSPQRGIFVAVSNLTDNISGVMTSPDGINWSQQTPASNSYWLSVCWSAELGLFVAIANNPSGTTNRIMSSPDGIKWTSRFIPSVINLRSICWSPELGMFVIVANSGSITDKVLTSSLRARPPTSYNVFDSSSNRIDQNGNWTIQQTLKSGTYTAGQTTPSVAGTNLLYITNTASTTITNFTGGVANQRLILAFQTAVPNTIIEHNTSIRLNGVGNFIASQYDTLTLVFTGSVWVELYRSTNA